MPRVFGFVSISPAVLSSSFFMKSSQSNSPFASLLTLTTSKPHMLAEAGFVPWAESGTNILFLWVFSSISVIGGYEQ
jgi:hypothetical protein